MARFGARVADVATASAAGEVAAVIDLLDGVDLVEQPTVIEVDFLRFAK